MPVIQIAIAGFLVAFGYLGVRFIRQSEKRSIWVGMAKETAHQLGTPISSMMGWVDLLEDGDRPGRRVHAQHSGGRCERTSRDSGRSPEPIRAGGVDAAPLLERLDPNTVISQVAQYLRRRLPTRARKVEILEQLEDVPLIDSDPELLAWTVENLMKNAADAIPEDARGDGTHRRSGRRPERPRGSGSSWRTTAPASPNRSRTASSIPGSLRRREAGGSGWPWRAGSWRTTTAVAIRSVAEHPRSPYRVLGGDS